ncbi:Teneurin-3, partial [Durusdinium trenchii]
IGGHSAMAEDDKNAGAWSRVPVWDGDPKTWRSFRKEMTWWLEALDVQSTKKYNLAARWLLRQSGIVRQRGEEFTPAELAFQPAIMAKDPETGDDIELTPEDPLAGINKLLRALETINGKTQLDKRGDLRNSFYLELKRKPQERISEFCTRFRSAVAELRMEGVTLPTAELGWFLKQKLGLDALRQQLLETALQGKESYEETEVEVLRLFRDLHSADPLAKKTFHGGDQQPRGPPLMQRFLAQQRAVKVVETLNTEHVVDELPPEDGPHEAFAANMTVAQIKEKVKPTVELLKSKPASKNYNKASSSSQDYAKPTPTSSPAVAKAPPTMTYSTSPQVAEMQREHRQNQAQFAEMMQQVAGVLDLLSKQAGQNNPLQTAGELPEHFSLSEATPMQIDSILNGETDRTMGEYTEAELRQLAGESMESVYQDRLDAQYGDLEFVDLAKEDQVRQALVTEFEEEMSHYMNDEIFMNSRILMSFALELAEEQLRGGRHYALENPAPSGAWQFSQEANSSRFIELYSDFLDGWTSDQFNLDAKKFTAQNSSEVLAVGNNMEDELEGEHFAPPTLDSDSDLETKEASGNPEKIPAAIKAEEERVPADLPPVEPQEMVGAMQAGLEPLLRPLSPTTEHTEHSSSSVKRGPEIDAERLRAESEAASQAEPPPSELNDTLVVSKHEILSVLNNHAEDVHPLMKIYSEACVDRANPLDAQVRDHGTWRGSWGMPSPSEWKARQSLGLTWPCGVDDINDVNAVQTARLSEASGWHFEKDVAMQVARNAKSFRSPEPRLDPKKYPLRSSYGRFDHTSGFSEWKILEDRVPYKELGNSQAPIGVACAVLISIFAPMPPPTKEKRQL